MAELTIAHEAIAIVTDPEHPLDCLRVEDLYGLMSAEAEAAGVATWDGAATIDPPLRVSPGLPDERLWIAGNPAGLNALIDLALADLAQQRGQEDAIRTDFPGQTESRIILEEPIADAGLPLGWSPLNGLDGDASEVKVLAIDDGDGCVDPSAATVNDGRYPLARQLRVHVDIGRAADRPEVGAFVDVLLDAEGYATQTGAEE